MQFRYFYENQWFDHPLQWKNEFSSTKELWSTNGQNSHLPKNEALEGIEHGRWEHSGRQKFCTLPNFSLVRFGWQLIELVMEFDTCIGISMKSNYLMTHFIRKLNSRLPRNFGLPNSHLPKNEASEGAEHLSNTELWSTNFLWLNSCLPLS